MTNIIDLSVMAEFMDVSLYVQTASKLKLAPYNGLSPGDKNIVLHF